MISGYMTREQFLSRTQHRLVYVFTDSIHIYATHSIYCTDISKAIRIDYGANTLYMHLAIEALSAWEQWNKERAENDLAPVYHNTGIITFSTNGRYTNYEKDNIKSIRDAGHGDYIEELDADELKKRYPHLSDTVDNGYNIAYYNKAGGKYNLYALVNKKSTMADFNG